MFKMSKLYNIKNWTRQNLWAWMVENAETQSKMQAFRADQIFYWLYQQKVESFAEMLNISQEIRKMLEEHFWISSMKIAESQKSQDGSIKYRLLLEDGYSIECVFMPHTNHNTVCVSSQVGCGMGYLSPIGAIGMYWSTPILKKSSDVIENFGFSLGTGF